MMEIGKIVRKLGLEPISGLMVAHMKDSTWMERDMAKE